MAPSETPMFLLLNTLNELKIRAPPLGARVLDFFHWRVRGRGPASPGGAFHPHPRKFVQRKMREPTGKWRKNAEESLNGRWSEM